MSLDGGKKLEYPMQTQGEHANSTQKDQGPDSNLGPSSWLLLCSANPSAHQLVQIDVWSLRDVGLLLCQIQKCYYCLVLHTYYLPQFKTWWVGRAIQRP